jgi:hypothetical protein
MLADGDDPSCAPIGCVIVLGGNILAARSNHVEEHYDATAHAEIEAMAYTVSITMLFIGRTPYAAELLVEVKEPSERSSALQFRKTPTTECAALQSHARSINSLAFPPDAPRRFRLSCHQKRQNSSRRTPLIQLR